MADTEEFRNLLAAAIHRIRDCEGNKPISAIHDELGHALGKAGGGTAVAYWRKGNLPKVSDLEKLAQALVIRGKLDQAWLWRFLTSADYPHVDHLCYALFPAAEVVGTVSDIAVQIRPLPFTKSYRALLGREHFVNEILTVLSDPNARSMVAIDGIGGIGKTALAQEVVLVCQKQQLFSSVVWINGAKGHYQWGSNATALTFDTVLNAIGNQFQLPDLVQLSEVEKASRIYALLRRHRILIILDNLETAAESQTTIIQKLKPILGISKTLLTSRRRFTDDLYVIHLTGIELPVVAAFLRQEAIDRRITGVEHATDSELAAIAEVTGASPLAMKLVVGQLGFLTLNVVLTHLQAVKPLASDSESDEYIRLYKYIYFPSWQLLSDLSKDLLVDMTPFVPGFGGFLPAIQAVSTIPAGALPSYIRELWQLSLVEIGEGAQAGLSAKRYYLHPLTRHFVLSDIVQEAL